MNRHKHIIAVVAALSVIAALATAQIEIPIGSEIGPEHIFGSGWWFIDTTHNEFSQHSFFYPDMAECGIDYNMARFTPTIGNFNMRDIYDASDLRVMLNPANPWHWKSEHLLKTDTSRIWWEDFFPGGPGNAARNMPFPNDANDEGFQYWETRINPRNTGGYIIGVNGAGNNELANNWVSIKKYRAFNVGNAQGDTYYIRFLMKRLNSMTDPTDTLLTLHTAKWVSEDSVNTVGTYYKLCNEIPTDWGWVEFYCSQIIIGNAALFALQWHGKQDSGDVKIRAISFQSNINRLLFPNPDNPDSAGGGIWNAFMDGFGVGVNDMGERVMGFMAKEPWKYSWHSCNVIRDSLENRFAGNYLYSAMEPAGESETDIFEFLNSANVDNLILDGYPINAGVDGGTWCWHWENSYDGNDSNGIIGISIQEAWDDWIECDHGIRIGAETAQDLGKDLWAGIQSSGALENMRYNADSSLMIANSSWYTEPTPRMVKCNAFLAMTFAPKGFFYSYYGPAYHHLHYDNWENSKFFAHPIPEHPTRWQSMNGAIASGLVSLYYDQDSSCTNDDEVIRASSLLGGQESGWLIPNEKWEAAREFNDYVRSVESFYSRCDYNQSVCAADVNLQVGRITIDSTYTFAGVADDSAETYLQVGLLFSPIMICTIAEPQTFMLVNRRCADDETRIVRFKVSYNLANYLHAIREVASGEVLAVGFGNSLSVVDTLEPGVGKLYFTSTNLQVNNDIPADTKWAGLAIVSGAVKVLAGVRLEILPGTLVLFEGEASLTVNGQLVAKGKADSLITFTKLNSESTGLVTLKGYSSDSLSFCKFTHLDKGLKISKYGSSYMNHIDDCEFSYNTDEGLYVSGGKVSVDNSEFHDNGGDGIYLYNCTANLDSTTVTRNQKNGIYCYSVNTSSTISHSVFQINGKGNDSAPDGNMRIYNCSPTLHHNVVNSSAEYGIYGVNGAYPVMYQGTSNAANTITGNASHETYWDYSWPLLDEGHNNFSTEDDTVIYITASTPLSYFYAEHNYWGGGNPHTGTGSKTYYGPAYFDWDPCDYVEQSSVPGGEDIGSNMKGGGTGGFGTIADAEEDARDLLKDAIDDESENPARSMDAYRRVITCFGNSSAAPIAVERLLWMVRNHFEDNRRLDELNGLNILYRSLADTSQSRALVWKARRAALPRALLLDPAYPNPFNSWVSVQYEVPERGEVSLKIFDLSGREVTILHEGNIEAGVHSVTWDASSMTAGVYICRLRDDCSEHSTKIVLVK